MKCSKCGAVLDDEFNICPVCGHVNGIDADDEEISSEIGSKIDRILGTGDVEGLDDGVEMRAGHMETAQGRSVSDTQKFTVPDTVFEGASEEEIVTAARKKAIRKQELEDQYHWDKSEWEDLDDEAMLEKLRSDNPDSFTGQEIDEPEYREKVERPVRTQTSRTSQISKTSGASKSSQASRPANKRKPRVREAKKAPGGSHAGLIIGIIVSVLVMAAIGVILYTGIYKDWVFWESDETHTTTVSDSLTCNVTEGGTYSLPLQITIESAANNRIYYTLDGTEPGNNSLKYNGPITISGDFVTWTEAPYTLRVVTYTSTSIKAAELTVNFTVRKPDIAAPIFSLSEGTYDTAQGITISAEQGATIYYTYDEWGTIPTTESNVYRGTIEMLGGTNVLSAIAVNGDRISEVAQVVYTLSLAINYSYSDAYNKIASKVSGEGYIVSEYEPETTTTTATTTAPTEKAKETETNIDGKPKETETTTPATTAPTEAPKVTTAVLYNSGNVSIGGANYYCIWVQLFYDNGERADGMYYGVDSSSGAIVRLVNNGGEFSIY